jgi:hypothetical protein
MQLFRSGRGFSMDDRYPYIRFVISIAQVVAGGVALVVLLCGLASSCQAGGFGGFIQFVLTVLLAGVAYVGTMVWVESLRVFLDIEEGTRQLVERYSEQQLTRGPSPPAP